MRNFCLAAGSFNSFSRELALSQKSKITKPLSAMIFLSFVPTSPSITACAWSIYCCTKGLEVEKTHWAQKIDTPPYYLYPLRPGVTFTYMGVKVDKQAQVFDEKGGKFDNIFAAGEIIAGNILT